MATSSALTPVTFHGATLLTTLVNGIPHVVLKPICEAIGLDWVGQLQRLKRHPVLSQAMCLTHIPSDGGQQEAVCLPLDKLNGWLFGVNVSRTRPEIRERLIQYQRECFDVLAGHFMPQLANCTNQQSTPVERQQVADALGLSLCIAGAVQQLVAQAVLAGGDDWKHQRWVVSLANDKHSGNLPQVDRLDPDARILTGGEFTKLFSDATVTAWECAKPNFQCKSNAPTKKHDPTRRTTHRR